MNFQSLIEELKDALDQPLPGIVTQLKMSSMRHIREMMKKPPDLNNAVPSSVLILLYPLPGGNDAGIALIQRPFYDGVHGGQISLPGGRFEHTDKDLLHTAIRESKEEIGLDPGNLTILGKISDLYIPPSNYIVTPFIGYCTEKPSFYPDPAEVDDIIELPMTKLMDDHHVRCKVIEVRGMQIEAPCFDINGHIIWGATAMILNELKEILNRLSL
jgi:8-oxo-dGTP pyrophosphatase MutT (NUDIX family)